MKISELKNYQRILLLGYGAEGRAVHQFLQTVHPSAVVGIADQNTDPDYLTKQPHYDLAIKSPGITKEKVTIPHTTATNIFFANIKGPVIGVTGAKGKSTTASLINAILIESGLRSHLVGNIGTPAITQLVKPHTAEDIYVMELSSYQLDDIQYSPHIAVFLNIFSDHLIYHGSRANYFTAKANIIRFCTAKDYFVYNPDDADISKLISQTSAKPTPFVAKLPFSLSSAPLQGKHNEQDIKAAYTVVSILKLPQAIIEKVISYFQPLPHRMRPIGTFSGRTFIDDGAATTPESTIFALATIATVGTLLLGGEERGQDFAPLAEKISSSKVQTIIAFPDTGKRIIAEIKKRNSRIKCFEAKSMVEAVTLAFQNTSLGETVLLSSASPSYSLWKNFVEKGQQYQEAVKAYDKTITQEKNRPS